MELEGFVTGLAIAVAVGFLGCVIELVQLRRRCAWLESQANLAYQVCDGLCHNVNDLARLVRVGGAR